MSDDIVTRLRELAIGSLYGISIAPFEHYNAAADEIERLRAEVSRLMQVICDSSPDDDYFLVRQEADAIWEQIHKNNQRT